MNEMYEKPVLKLTEFDCEDVITTSSLGINNIYTEVSKLDGTGTRELPTTPWY